MCHVCFSTCLEDGQPESKVIGLRDKDGIDGGGGHHAGTTHVQEERQAWEGMK